MSDPDQIGHFSEAIEAVIVRFQQEYDLTYAAAIGVLHLAIFDLSRQALEETEDDDGPT